MSTRMRVALLTGTCATALVATWISWSWFPAAVRVPLGLLLLLGLPGFATVNLVLPHRPLRPGPLLLASLGVSLGVATTLCVALAATRVGLTRGSLSNVLGLATAGASALAILRIRLADRARP